MTDQVKVRLSKLMSERGLCSRREADALIEQGLVKVNGELVRELGTKVLPNCEIELLPRAQKELSERVTILLNKPVGYVSGQPEPPYEPAVRLIRPETEWQVKESGLRPQHFDGLAPAGRLDIDSQGLLVFTQNGSVAKLLIGDDSRIEKEYLVRVQGKLSDADLKLLNHGLSLDEKPLRPAQVEWVNQDQLRFVLKEGKKRQIRRMCELVGLRVTGLKRVRIGRIRLGALPEGQWRFLGPGEQF